MQFQLKCQFRIESARFLPQLPPDHPCRRMHGHSFVIWMEFVGALNAIGWVEDYHVLQNRLQEQVFSRLDHRVLNEIPGLENPTTEHLTRWIYEQSRDIFPQLQRVSVSETERTECVYPALKSESV